MLPMTRLLGYRRGLVGRYRPKMILLISVGTEKHGWYQYACLRPDELVGQSETIICHFSTGSRASYCHVLAGMPAKDASFPPNGGVGEGGVTRASGPEPPLPAGGCPRGSLWARGPGGCLWQDPGGLVVWHR